MFTSSDVDDWDRWFLGRAPRTRETLPDFRESGQVTQKSRVFRRLTGSQRTPGEWGVTIREKMYSAVLGMLIVSTEERYIMLLSQ